ncbi:MAG: hypothetical protein HEQ35_28420 [Gloeotrichia echinulata IR180]|nr:hypothetical protein [Gloeotrichia echinulata DEX184]
MTLYICRSRRYTLFIHRARIAIADNSPLQNPVFKKESGVLLKVKI